MSNERAESIEAARLETNAAKKQENDRAIADAARNWHAAELWYAKAMKAHFEADYTAVEVVLASEEAQKAMITCRREAREELAVSGKERGRLLRELQALLNAENAS